jgi:hypothetical protein
MDKVHGVLAFVDVAMVFAVPVIVIVLARRGRALWKSYALVLFPYLIYEIFAGRMPYLSAYILMFACLAPGWALMRHEWRCEGWWQVWGTATVILGVIPTALLWIASVVSGRAKNSKSLLG